MKKSNTQYTKGIISTVLLSVILLVIALIVIFYAIASSDLIDIIDPTTPPSEQIMEDTSAPPEVSPVSESTELEDIEAELDATVTGDAGEDINSLLNETNEL